MPMPQSLTALLLVSAWFMPGQSTAAQTPTPPQTATQPAPQPEVQSDPEPPALIIRELVVLQADRYGSVANDPKQVQTTLIKPIEHEARIMGVKDRGGYKNTPMPLGLLTAEGQIDATLEIEFKLIDASGMFHANWPGAAINSDRSIKWPGIQTATEKQRAEPFAIREHWLMPLRESEDRLWLRTRDPLRKERFMLYDASLPFTSALEVKEQDNTYQLIQQDEAAAPPLTLLVHREPNGWHADAVLSPWPASPAKIGGKPEADQLTPLVAPSLQPLADLLTDRGYNAAEIALAIGMVQNAGLETSSMSLVYVLPEGAIDSLISLRISPEPDQLIRTAIVVMTNADPNIDSYVKTLIVRLGSDRWIERAEAQKDLENMGQAAIKQVQGLIDDRDREVAFRARQILNAYDADWAANDIQSKQTLPHRH